MTAALPIATGYGIDIAGDAVTAVRGRRRARGVEVDVLMEGASMTSPAWTTLAATIAREQAAGNAMVFGVALARDSFMRPVETPFSSVAKARAVFPSLLDVQLPFPLEKCACQFVRIEPAANRGVRALALAVPFEQLTQRLQEYRAAGVDPEWIEQEGVALWRQIAGEPVVAQGGPAVVVYVGADRTVLVAGSAGRPVNALSAGGTGRASPGDAARDRQMIRLKQFLAGAFRGSDGGMATFFVTGPDAKSQGEAMRDALQIDPAHWVMLAGPSTVLARSLVVGGLRPDTWSANLRTGDHAHENIARLARRTQVQSFAWVAAAALLMVLLGAGALAYVKQINMRTARERQSLAAEQAAGRSAGEALRVWAEADAHILLNDILRAAQTAGAKVASIGIQSGRAKVRMVADRKDDVDALRRAIEETGRPVRDTFPDVDREGLVTIEVGEQE